MDDTGKALQSIEQRLATVEDGLGRLQTEVHAGFSETTVRLDMMNEHLSAQGRTLVAIHDLLQRVLNLGPRVDDLDHRVTRLEARR